MPKRFLIPIPAGLFRRKPILEIGKRSKKFLRIFKTGIFYHPADLEKWLKDLGEFQDCLNEEGSVRYVRMTCKTDDPDIEKSYLDFLEKISEPSKPKFFALSKKYWECPYRPFTSGERLLSLQPLYWK